MPLSFGVCPGHAAGGDVYGAVELAEALGYESVWFGDHVLWFAPSPDPMLLLAAASARTSRIRLGTGILLAALRPPAVVAKAAATLDHLSEGRFTLGVGIGGENPAEFENSGIDVHERSGRLDETIAICRALWTQPSVDFSGRYFTLRDARFDLPPRTAGGPPIWVGGRAPGSLKRAGLLGDGWLAFVVSAERFAASWQIVREHAAKAGRDPAAIVPALQLWCQFDDDRARARAIIAPAMERMYQTPYERFERYCIAGDVETWLMRLREYEAAGVRQINLIFSSGDVATQLVRVAEEVMPYFQ
ncbi:MAG: LLM class flavin-dependent oxidoreductase [Dehalococcoidia bacterium]